MLYMLHGSAPLIRMLYDSIDLDSRENHRIFLSLVNSLDTQPFFVSIHSLDTVSKQMPIAIDIFYIFKPKLGVIRFDEKLFCSETIASFNTVLYWVEFSKFYKIDKFILF